MTADEALDAFLGAVARGDTASQIGATMPEALVGLSSLAGAKVAAGDWRLLSAEDGDGGVKQVVQLGADASRTLRLTWRRIDKTWKVAAMAWTGRVPVGEEEPVGVLGGPLDLGWLTTPAERLPPPPVGPRGLTLEAVSGGDGVPPARATSRSLKPRGAAAASAPPSFAITVLERAEVWSPEAARLYEEAVARRWRPALDLPWGELVELPEATERALCQLCTTLSEYAAAACDAPAAWQHRIAYDFHEVKLFLAAQGFDAARLVEAFRKRALANGGGLGVQTPGRLVRRALDAQSYAELSLAVHVVLAGHVEMLLFAGAAAAPGPVEARLFGLAVQDVARWLAYGVSRLRAQLVEQPAARAGAHDALDRAEAALAADLDRDEALAWALRTLLGEADRRRARQRAVRRHLARLTWAGLDDRAGRLDPRLLAAVD